MTDQPDSEAERARAFYRELNGLILDQSRNEKQVRHGDEWLDLRKAVERLAAAEATIARVREVAEDIGNWGWPNAQAREYSASLLAALDGDTPKDGEA